MEWIRRIVKTPIEPEDKDVFWLDISVPNYAVLKYYENGEWKIVRHSEDGIAYILPVGGIPYSDLSQDVKNRIDLAKEQSDWNQSDESAVDYIKNKPNVAAKADKVEGATAGNLASLDAEGNITDSGISKDFIEDNYQHLYHCTLQEVLNPKDGDICIVPISYNNIPITGIDDSNIFNFTSVNRKVKWRVTNGAEEWFFFRWTSDSEEVITTPNLPENVTGFPVEGIVDITNSTGEASLIWNIEFKSSMQYLTLYDVVPESAYVYIAESWIKLSDIEEGISLAISAYQKPQNGIPKSDLSQSVQDTLDMVETIPTLSVGLFAFIVEDGELKVVQNAEAGTFVRGDITEDGEVELYFNI